MKRLILIALAGMAAALAAQADIIYVQGDVSGTWAADTVMVTGEVRVPPGQTLVIQPGVKVLFQVYCKFIVDSAATLRAVGTEADSIIFDEFIWGNHWHGIRFLSASNNSRLEYCRLAHGQALGSGEDGKGGAISCSNSDPPILHCWIENCTATLGGAISCNNSDPNIGGTTITGNSASSGGGIYCNSSSPIISNNTIIGNSAGWGGAIFCTLSSNPTINSNYICQNSANYYGGGISCAYSSSPNIINNSIRRNGGGGIDCYDTSSPVISGNVISENSIGGYGGGIACYGNCNPIIIDNIISGNEAGNSGGGISCEVYTGAIISGNTIVANSASFYGGGGISCNPYALATILGNIIRGNSATYGGGVRLWDEPTEFERNEITYNLASSHGGGVYGEDSAEMDKNTISFNTAVDGGGVCFSGYFGAGMLRNCILWGNAPQQIYLRYSASIQVTYSNIESGWPGLGNISLYSAFVDTAYDDYRLLWGSPCIDSGDPNPIYNDPDGTRSDMGAFYYDQSTPIRILLSPHEIPYLIAENGGSMDYTIRAFNRDSLAHAATVWCNVTLPDSSIYGPVLGPVTVTIGAGALLERVRTQNVPAVAPMGVYHYDAYAVVGSDTSKDSFMWGKLGTSNLSARTPSEELGTSNWTNTGEPITDMVATRLEDAQSAAADAPAEYALHPCSPNPFNAETAISYQLPADSYVSLRVYDTAGKLVASLVDGWRSAGVHEVTFDAGTLPSGMYICRIQAGEFEAAEKLALLK